MRATPADPCLRAPKTISTTRRPSILENGKRYRLDLTVRGDKQQASVVVKLDNQSIVDWQGPAASLGISEGWGLPRGDTFGLMTNEPAIFHQAKLKVIFPILQRDLPTGLIIKVR